MAELSDDEALQLAIKMSLEAASDRPDLRASRKPQPTVIDLVEESEEPPHGTKAHPTDRQSQSTADGAGSQMNIFGIHGLDRKVMEQERLARAAQRQTRAISISPPPARNGSSYSNKRQKIDQAQPRTADEAPAGVVGIHSRPLGQNPVNTTSTNNKVGGAAPVQYPQGVIKRTWARSHDRSNDVKIEEVFQREHLRKAMLSSFQWDHDWLFGKIDVKRTDLLLVVQGKTQAERDAISAEGLAMSPRIKLCFPPMPGQVNCMHSKLMLLFYDNYMRAVVPTANLTEYDWGDDGRMENSVFMIDLPEGEDTNSQALEDLTPFGQELFYFLECMGAPEHLLKAILRYNFSKTVGLAFIHSVGGSHAGQAKGRTGYPGLSRAIRQLGLQAEKLDVDLAASSLGAIKDEFLRAVYAAAKGEFLGETPMTELRGGASTYKSHLRVYYPTHDTVVNSFGGPEGAGTICFQQKWYSDPGFPRELMRDYRSTRPGLLSHNKAYFGRGLQKNNASAQIAWAYVGSHNLSESAWGRVVADKKMKETKINCRNWECGVLMPIALEDDESTESRDVPSMEVFRRHVDVPFEYPGETYAGRQPWFRSTIM